MSMTTVIEIDAELTAHLDAERRGMRDLFMHIADMREHDPQGANDPRYREAAANLRHLAESVAQIDDRLLLKVGLIAKAIEDHGGADLIGELIAAKLTAVCFEVEPYADASSLLMSITDAADVAAAKRNGRLC